MDKYKFGEFIYNQRKKLGLTQDELGRKLKVTNKAVSKWETGETLPDIQLLENLASTLNVTIDELLTQRKQEIEKVYLKPKIFPRVIHGLITFILLIVVVFLSIKIINKDEVKEEITIQNVHNYFLITPCEKSELNGKKLTIYGSIKEKTEILDSKLVISFNIQYYYRNVNNELSEIIYVDREIVYQDNNEDFSITLEPKDQINNFQSFEGFNVNYKIIEVKGRINYEE